MQQEFGFRKGILGDEIPTSAHAFQKATITHPVQSQQRPCDIHEQIKQHQQREQQHQM